jgi:hypothetical protein
MNDAIGGYFELETPFRGQLYPSALGYNSARYAFEALLAQGAVRRVHLPWYTCSTLVEAARRSGVDIQRYCLDKHLQPVDLPELEADERLLYVNYFGYKAPFIEQVLLPRFAGRLIADHAQALFSRPLTGVPTLYSPRKFLGVPDGGWLLNAPSGLQPLPATPSKTRFAALLGRLEDGPEGWYASHVEVEQGIRDEGLGGMSVLTARWLGSIDYAAMAKRRAANLVQVHEAFGRCNGFEVPVQPGLAPMCYPLLLERAEQADRLRSELARQRIYLATYWKDVLEAGGGCEVARTWAQCMLPLPIDQRYGPEHMERLIEAVKHIGN